MDHFVYRDGELYCEQVPVARIAADYGTPLFIYSAATLRQHYRVMAEGFAEVAPLICFSIKSCQNLHILRLLASLGAGMDVVSGGELHRALRAGVEPAKIVFAGVGKTDAEIEQAIAAGIGLFNVESEAELENLLAIAGRMKRSIRAALRINPDVDPRTHRHTSTGKRESKFGVDVERGRRVFREYGGHGHVHLCGIHLHIGSPVYEFQPYVDAVNRALALIDQLRADGFAIDTLDIGGGFGASYQDGQSPSAADYAAALVPLLRGRNLRVIVEPGRSISGNAGILVGRVLYVKHSGEKAFLIIDAAMTELIRPALYDAFHFVWPVRPAEGQIPPGRRADLVLPGCMEMDVVGPVCETGDFLARGRYLPAMRAGDYLAVFTAGAYGFVMSSHYNSRPNAAEVLVDGDRYRLIRRRETYADLIAAEEGL